MNGIPLSQGHWKNLNNQDNCRIEFWAAQTTKHVRISQYNFTSFWPNKPYYRFHLLHVVTAGNAISLLYRNQQHSHRYIRKNNSNFGQLCMLTHIRRSKPSACIDIPSPSSLLGGYLLNSFFNICLLVLDYCLNQLIKYNCRNSWAIGQIGHENVFLNFLIWPRRMEQNRNKQPMKSRHCVLTHYWLFLPNRELFSLENNHLDSYTTFIARIHKHIIDSPKATMKIQ